MEQLRLDEFSLVDFRNIAAADLKLHDQFNIIFGANGMGKTNLLEAVYLLGSLRSFRTSSRGELVREGADKTKIRGLFGGAAAGLDCEMEIGPGERRVLVGGKPATPGGGHFRTLPMVLFHPGNMTLVQGGPDHRRRFLDRALFQATTGYPRLHRDYARVLANRNRLLKQRPADPQAMAPFEEQLATLAEHIVVARREFLEQLGDLFSKILTEISGGQRGEVSYRPSIEGNAEQMLAALVDRRGRDNDRGFTSIGPHADDLELTVDGRSARRYASQGQQRTVVLSLKIAETRALTLATGRRPVMLLDDVSSELDRERNRHLFDFLTGVGGQVFLTTTHRDHVLISSDRLEFHVTDGKIQQVDEG